MIVDEEIKPRMIKPKSPEVDVWKVNDGRRRHPIFKPTSEFLLNKYTSQQNRGVFQRMGGFKRARSPDDGFRGNYGWQRNRFDLAPRPSYNRAYADVHTSLYRPWFQQYSGVDGQWQKDAWPARTRYSDVHASDAIVLYDPESGVQPRVQKMWVPRSSFRFGVNGELAASSKPVVGKETVMSDKFQSREVESKKFEWQLH